MSNTGVAPFDPRDDIVDDRALQDAADDQFGHKEFAAQAAQVLRVVATPTNISIYAPWGSGKTSLANLLRKELKGTNCGFVYFDAFKYAEAPLRREFIRRVAKELDVKDAKFDRGLYEEETKSDFSLDKETVRKLVKVLLWTAAGATIAVFAVALVIAALSGNAIRPEWSAGVKRLLPALAASSIVIVPLISLVKDHLHVTRHRFAPQSDEEFERLFRDLIDAAFGQKEKKKWKQLVVFIDELDRCASDEVASTLETLRTFLEVSRCVFVVAADRQVLERAAARRARQETPYDPRNPYYSAGSSYLDKIFQLQWHLPPLMGSSLTRFAQALVQGRSSGVWSEVDAGQVVSVLVPVHVQSPRRVKELLNAFSMTYRVAERRKGAGRLDCDLKDRAPELAKLVCLQLEFPAFAADLRNEPSLPELVLQRFEVGIDKCPPGVSPEVWERAKAYADGRIELDTVMTRTEPRTEAPYEPEGVPDAAESVEDGEPEDVARDTTQAPNDIVAAQAHLLIRYLQKTRRVEGPAADLVFLEGLGSAFGLSTSLAVLLKTAAAEGRIPDAAREIGRLPPDQQLEALRLLSTYVREALPGIEGQNVLRVLLGVVGELRDLDLTTVVDGLVDAINTAIGDGDLPKEELIGALRLALSTRRAIGTDLVARVLKNDAAVSDASIAFFVLNCASEIAPAHDARLGEVFAAVVVDLDWEELQLDFSAWRDERAVAIFDAARQPLLRRVEEIEKAAESETTAATAETPAPKSQAEEEEEIRDIVLDALNSLIDVASEGGRRVLVEALLSLILSLDTTEARHKVAERLPSLGTAQSESLTLNLLRHGRRRSPEAQIPWLDAVDPRMLHDNTGAKDILNDLVAEAWSSLVKKPDHAEPYARAAARVAGTFGLPLSDWKLAEVVRSEAALATTDQPTLETFQSRLRVTLAFERENLLAPSDWRPSFVDTLSTLATNAIDEGPVRSLARDLLLDSGADLVPRSGDDPSSRFDNAVAGSPWLPEAEKHLGRLKVAAARTEAGESVTSPVNHDQLVRARQEAPDEATRAIVDEASGVWLQSMRPTVAEAWEVIRAHSSGDLADSLRNGLTAYSEKLTAAERTSLLSHAIEHFPEEIPDEDFLEASRLHESDLESSADQIATAFTRVTNEDHRRSSLRLWRAMHLTDSSVSKRLIDAVMIPMINGGKTSRDTVLHNLDLVQPADKDTKVNLTRAFRQQSDDAEWSVAQRRLLEAGLMKEKGLPGFRRTTHLDE